MKTIIFFTFIIFTMQSNASTFQEERLNFGSKLLTSKFEEFKSRHSICVERSKTNKLPPKVIEALKKLPISIGEGLGYLNLRAIRNCSSPEYNDVTRLLLSVDIANTEIKNSSVESNLMNVKMLMFPVGELSVEKKYYELPLKTQNILSSIAELKEPFDMVDAFERAWLN